MEYSESQCLLTWVKLHLSPKYEFNGGYDDSFIPFYIK
jgi:hypothetical protein